MRRSTLRFLALLVLVFLGAPVALHFVLHDLHDHPAAHASAAMIEDVGGHGDHEHPIVTAPSPQIPSVARAAFPVFLVPSVHGAALTRLPTAERNMRSLGALRTDTDVGLQPLLSTFLI